MTQIHDKEKSLQREISGRVENALRDVEVLAVELNGPERFTVFIDRAGKSVDHALCERVTDVLRDYLREYTVDVSSPGSSARCASRSTSATSSAGKCSCAPASAGGGEWSKRASELSPSRRTTRPWRFPTRSCAAT